MTSILNHFARLIPALALTSLALTMKADTATNKTLFDFQAATNSPAWEVVNDDVMGGVSTSQFQVLTNGCAVFSGTVRLENNGGFARALRTRARDSHRPLRFCPAGARRWTTIQIQCAHRGGF